MHNGHKLINISDIDSLKKENITINSENKELLNLSEKIINLKNKIELEINKLNKLYDETTNNLTKSFNKKHEQLLKYEKNLKDELNNETTKIKEKLENYLTEINNIIRISEKIQKGLNKFEKNDKNIIKNITYISKINKTKKNMKNILLQLMKNINIIYEEDKNKIKYDVYFFNGIHMTSNIELIDINLTSINIKWNIDNIKYLDIDNNKIKYILELKKENEKFEKIYEGNNTKFILNNLFLKNNYEYRICYFYNDLIGPWTNIHNFNLSDLLNLELKDILKPNKQIKLWENNGLIKDEFIILFNGSIQYGPYFFYEFGKYLVIYYGEGLLNGDFDCIDTEFNFPINILEKSETKCIYEVDISKKSRQGVEFRAFNHKNDFILIKNIEVFKYKN